MIDTQNIVTPNVPEHSKPKHPKRKLFQLPLNGDTCVAKISKPRTKKRRINWKTMKPMNTFNKVNDAVNFVNLEREKGKMPPRLYKKSTQPYHHWRCRTSSNDSDGTWGSC